MRRRAIFGIFWSVLFFYALSQLVRALPTH